MSSTGNALDNPGDHSRRDVRHQRAGDQHGPAAPEHARRAARGPAPRRREGGRRRRRDRLPAPRHREAEREPQLDADHPAHRPDGLRRGGDQQRRLLRDRREADGDRGAAAGALRPHHPLRAAADREPLPVDRHARDGHRRDDGVPLRVPRARADPRSVRGDVRRAADLQLDAHRRAAAGSAAGLGQEGPPVLRHHGRQGRRVRGAADAQPDLARTDQGHRPDHRRAGGGARAQRPAAARLGRAARRPQGRAVRGLRRDAVRRAGRHRRRHLRSLSGADGRVPPVDPHHPAGDRRRARKGRSSARCRA